MPAWAWAITAASFVIAGAIGYSLAFRIATRAARQRSRDILKEAENSYAHAQREMDTLKREAILEAKDEALRVKQEADSENRQKRSEISKAEDRLAQREESLERRADALTGKESALAQSEADLASKFTQIEELRQRHQQELERLADMSSEEAREELMKSVREGAQQEIARTLRDLEQRAQDEGERKARNIISLAINRCAVDQAAETSVSVVPLPSDEMKGRIIGREGRNIRSFETLTGVDLIVDDTPEAVVLSAFDPVRREIARLALTELVEDGRIHPARIEEVVEKAREAVNGQVLQAADEALMEAGVAALSSELTRHFGRLKFRTSYGQNCLRHSIEVAHVAAFMAAELKADVSLARRAGLLHDIGKAVDTEMDGPHALIGMELLRKAGESEALLHAVGSHHNDIEPSSVEAVLVQAADAISASRPGARREALESYVKRLQKLETIAESFSGVEKTYAIQAGREIRVMVKPEEVDDETALVLARETAKRIEQEMEYPGQIKVTVIRETRAVDYAK